MTKENPSSSKEHDIQCICKFSSLVIRLIVNTISVSSVFTFFLHQLHVYIIKSTPVLFGKEEIKLTIFFFTCTCSCQALSYTLQLK